jgi:hypothetical protein
MAAFGMVALSAVARPKATLLFGERKLDTTSCTTEKW